VTSPLPTPRASTRLAGWKEVNVQETLERELGVQVIADNFRPTI